MMGLTGRGLVALEGMADLRVFQGLKAAGEVAPAVHLSPARLLDLANARIVPHVRTDRGEPLFHLPQLRRHIARYLTEACPGAPLPLNLRPVVTDPVTIDVPLSLSLVKSRLAEYEPVPACVYFLVGGQEVVYVGQSTKLPVRLQQHREAGKSWERVLYMPLPEAELAAVESAWIRALKPPLNKRRENSAA